MTKKNLVGAMLALVVAAPVMAQGKSKAAKGRVETRDTRDTRDTRKGSIEDILRGRREAQAERDHIPPGQLPPKGMCRIWIDGVPPGQQPAPTDCNTAIARRPANARVIFGDETPFPGKGKGKEKAAKSADDRNDGGIWGVGRDDDDDDDAADRGKGRGKGKGRGGDDN